VLKGEPEKIKGTMTDETCCEAKTAEQAKTADTVPKEDATKENGGTDEKPAAEKEAAEKAAADKAAAEKAAADKAAADKAAAEKEAEEKKKKEDGKAEEDHGQTDEQKKKPEEAVEKKKENGKVQEEKKEGKEKESVPEKKEEEKGKEADQEKEKKSKETTPEVADPEAGANFPLGTQCWEFGIDRHDEKSQKERDARCEKGLICARYTHDQGQGLFGWTTLGERDWRKECDLRGWGDENCNSIGGKDKFRCSTDPGDKEVKICNVVNGSKSTAETCGCGTDICEKDEYCIIDHAGKKAEEKGNPCVAMCEETKGMKQTANKCMCSKPEYICEVNEVCFIRKEQNKDKISCEPAPQEPPKESEQAGDAEQAADADEPEPGSLEQIV